MNVKLRKPGNIDLKRVQKKLFQIKNDQNLSNFTPHA